MATAKHGGRGTRGWKKLHLGVDRAGMIVAQALTEARADNAVVGIDLIGAATGDVASVTGDGAYDTVAFYEAASARHARVVVPPTKTAKVARRGPRSSARDRAVTDVEVLGRRQWKKASGYHRQARVENAFFRYTSGSEHSSATAGVQLLLGLCRYRPGTSLTGVQRHRLHQEDALDGNERDGRAGALRP